MNETPPKEPTADVSILITKKAVRDFKRVLEQQEGKRWDADCANDNEDDN